MKHTLAVIGRWSATLVVFAIAVVAALAIWHRYETRPWTRDGRVRADVVRVASDMGIGHGAGARQPAGERRTAAAGAGPAALRCRTRRPTQRPAAHAPRWHWPAANRRGTTHWATWSLRKPANAMPPRSIPSWPPWQARAEQRVARLMCNAPRCVRPPMASSPTWTCTRATTCSRGTGAGADRHPQPAHRGLFRGNQAGLHHRGRCRRGPADGRRPRRARARGYHRRRHCRRSALKHPQPAAGGGADPPG